MGGDLRLMNRRRHLSMGLSVIKNSCNLFVVLQVEVMSHGQCSGEDRNGSNLL